ncbi:MAG: transcription elongation factor GreA [Gammaproteobacteria bacterium]|nr:transcription elongation factor GreA [Gammaproteobacteria bacterium]
MEKIPMTSAGESMLRLELERLKAQERPRIVQAIAEAREQGDLRENAEYQYAKEEQGFIEGRILDIERKLAHSNVIDVKDIPATGKVIFGVTVKILNYEDDSEVVYQIVGDDEADIKIGKISVYSPIARALIGKQIGDVVVVSTPKGQVEYEICSVEHL